MEELRERLGKYHYFLPNIANGEAELIANPFARQLLVRNAYQPEGRTLEGTCSDLTNSLYLELVDVLPHKHISRAGGQDDHFFVDGWHNFVLVSDESLCTETIFTEKDVQRALHKDPLIVDPSFQKIMRYSESNYKIRTICPATQYTIDSRDSILDEYHAIPLCIADADHLISLEAMPQTESLYRIRVTDASNSTLYLSPHTLKAMYPEDEILNRCLDGLESIPKSVVDNPLPIEHNIYVA